MRRARRTFSLLALVTILAYLGTAYCYYFRPWPIVAKAPQPAQIAVVPATPLRFVSWNVDRLRKREAVVEQIREMNPDFVMLQEVPGADIQWIVDSLSRDHPLAHHASENRPDSWDLLIARYPLFNARPIDGTDGGKTGVWAETDVNGQRFTVACVHFSATYRIDIGHLRDSTNRRYAEMQNLITLWENSGKPPLIVGGDFNDMPTGRNYSLMTQHFNDALASLGQIAKTFQAGPMETRIDYFLTFGDWQFTDASVKQSSASDHRAIFLITGETPTSAK